MKSFPEDSVSLLRNRWFLRSCVEIFKERWNFESRVRSLFCIEHYKEVFSSLANIYNTTMRS